MQLAESAGEAVLNEIVGGGVVPGQCPGITPKAWDFRFDVPVRVPHEKLPMAATTSRDADPNPCHSIGAV
jgi:hypothetical protein